MKSKNLLLASAFFVVFAIVPQVQGATLADIVGCWLAKYNPSLKISGYFSDRSVSDGDVSFYNTLDLMAYENDNGTIRIYWGAFLIEDGKKIISTMNINDFLEAITDWIEEVASGQGYTVTDISYDISSFKVSPCKIKQRNMSLGKVKITIKGNVNARVNGIYQTKRLSYKSIVTFGPKISDTPRYP